MKTVFQINVVVNAESTGRIVEEIGRVAIAEGWNSYIAFGKNKRSSQSNLIRIGSDLNMKLHGLQTRIMDNHALGLSSRSATKRLVEQIKMIKPDIIHLHNLHGYYINVDVLFEYLSKSRIPVIWTLHDCWPITGHCPHFELIGCDKWKVECYSCPQKTEYPASYVFDRSRQNYRSKKRLFTSLDKLILIPVSKWLSDILNESFLKEFPIQVINNGIDINLFKPTKSEIIKRKYNIKNRIILLGVAGTWGERKGMYDFIKLSKIIDDRFQIVLLGLNKNQLKLFSNNIIAIENTENIEELAAIYSLADVYLNLTYEDTFPTTNLEAMACGTPVITYKTGGSPEAIDEKTGEIVEKGDIEALIDAIERVIQKGKNYYSEYCLDRVERLYNKEDRFQDYLSLYNRLLDE